MKMTKHFDVFRNEMLKNHNIVDVTSCDIDMMMGTNSRSGTDWSGKPDKFDPEIFTTDIQLNFLDFMNIPIVEGENLSLSDTAAILLNETAARIMNFENPIGQHFFMNKGEKKYFTVKGVVKDFHFDLLNEKIGPLVISHNRGGSDFYIKTVPGGARAAVEATEKLWKEYNPDYNFEYRFLDDNFEYYYKTEIYMERLLSIFAIIAVLISCLGLFGLVNYSVECKTKEIGIRKVFGAKARTIASMISKEFLILAGIAMIIAVPLAYYLLDQMLQDYAYRITIGWQIFVLAAVVMIAIMLITVGWKVIRAATANPVDAIKN
jgi:putative ABC transport system permease protein